MFSSFTANGFTPVTEQSRKPSRPLNRLQAPPRNFARNIMNEQLWIEQAAAIQARAQAEAEEASKQIEQWVGGGR